MQESNMVETPKAVEALTEPKEPMTVAEYKKAMNAFFTVRRPTVNECGHKIDLDRQPNNNCEYCWFAFLNNHGELVQTADEVFQKHGPETLDRTRGVKFRKMFLRFMATVAKFVEEEQKAGRLNAKQEESENKGEVSSDAKTETEGVQAQG